VIQPIAAVWRKGGPYQGVEVIILDFLGAGLAVVVVERSATSTYQRGEVLEVMVTELRIAENEVQSLSWRS